MTRAIAIGDRVRVTRGPSRGVAFVVARIDPSELELAWNPHGIAGATWLRDREEFPCTTAHSSAVVRVVLEERSP